MRRFISILLLFCCVSTCVFSQTGIFEAASDIGPVKTKGAVIYNPQIDQYELTSSGTNIWGTSDEFYFLWKKLSGNFTLYTRMDFIGSGGNPHRKGGIMIRRTLNPSSAYADVVLHGDGLTSLQYRPQEGGETMEIKAVQQYYSVLQLRRSGNLITALAAHDGEPLQQIGPLGSGILRFDRQFSLVPVGKQQVSD